MYIEIDKDYTRIYRVKDVKKAIALFKKEFTENDLRNIFEEYFDEDCTGNIVDCEIRACEQNYYTNNIFFAIKMLIDDINIIKKIVYAIRYNPDKNSFEINTDTETVDYKIFE